MVNGFSDDGEILFSIVLPVYNGEQYIEDTIQSVLNQTYNNYELIVVNDGSTDRTHEIVKKYEQSNIKIVYKQNGGVSTARNAGMNYVRGDYLMFIDADDILETTALEVLCGYIKKYSDADLIIYGWKEFGISKRVNCVATESKILDTNLCVKKVMQTDDECGGGYPWNKLWKVTSIMQNGIIPEFKPELILCEDKEWVVRVLLNCKYALLVPDILYLYRRFEGENLSKVDFDIVSDKNDNRIVSFVKSAIYIEQTVSHLQNDTKLAELARKNCVQSVILVSYKALKTQNKNLQRTILKYYYKYTGKEIKGIHIKYLIMLFYIKARLLRQKQHSSNI